MVAFMIDVAVAIDRETESLILTPKNTGAYVAGVWVPAVSADVPIQAVVQPVPGKVRQDLPEGVKDRAKWAVWSRYDLKLGDSTIIEGDPHLIIHIMPRRKDGFVKAIAGEADGGN